MLLSEIKTQIGINSLQLNTAKTEGGVPTQWVRHWDNENRVAVSLHKELLAEIQSDPTISTLGIQTEIRTGSKGDYTAHRIVKYKAAEFTL